jgi:hypothetical protein
MGDYHYGGSDEESAEIRKINAEIVCLMCLTELLDLVLMRHRVRIRTTLKAGRSLCAPQNNLKEV